MHPAEAALRLVGPIYEAATNPSLWPDVLRQLASEVGGTTTGFMIHEVADPQFSNSILVTVNTDPALTREYEGYYHSINSHGDHIPTTQPGTVVWSQEYMTDTELQRSEYYNDFLKRYDLYYVVASFVTHDESQIVSTYTFRSQHAGPFSKESFQLHELLLPHLQNAAKLHSRLAMLQARCVSLDSFSAGVIIVDSDGRILQMNEAACRMLEANDGLTASLGRITLWDHREQSEFLIAIHNASSAAMGNGLESDSSLAVHRPSGNRPYLLRLRPIRSSRLLGTEQTAGAIIFVMDPHSQDNVHPSTLTRSFGLTPAEAKLSIALLSGKSLDECSVQLDISLETARTHLKRILSKTGTKRQGELIRLLLKTFGQLKP